MVDEYLSPRPMGPLKRLFRPLTAGLERVGRSFLPRGLFSRSMIIVVAPMILAQLVASYVFMERHYQLVTKRLSSAVAGEVATLIDTIERLEGADRVLFINSASQHLNMNITLVPGDTLPVMRIARNSVLDRTIYEEFSKKIDREFWFNRRALESFVEIRTITNDTILRIQVRRSRVLATNWHIFLVWMVGTSIIFASIALVFMRNQVRPVQRLAVAAQAFGKGRRVADFKPSGATEVRRAAEAFMEMRNRIERYVGQRTEMLAGVSHDLRTPLQRLRLEIAMMPESESTKAMKEDLLEMEQMLEAYLAFARGDLDERLERIDIRALLTELGEKAARKEASVQVVPGPALTGLLRPQAMRRCLNNLVQNAAVYGENVQLSARSLPGEGLEVIVDDDGPGIPEEKREAAFRPFHRLDPARSTHHAGTGLGLAIAQDIAHGHGGEIHLETSPLGGLRARVFIPQ